MLRTDVACALPARAALMANDEYALTHIAIKGTDDRANIDSALALYVSNEKSL